jgi:hypothetical protein
MVNQVAQNNYIYNVSLSFDFWITLYSSQLPIFIYLIKYVPTTYPFLIIKFFTESYEFMIIICSFK